MIDKRFFDDLNERISEAFRNSPAQDIEKNLKAMLAAGFSRLDLVLREDFEVQQKLLERAQTKLAELEARIAELESKRGTRLTRSSPAGGTRCRLPRWRAARSPGLTRPKSPSKCISAPACRHSTSSACRIPRCARRATACARRCNHARFEFPARRITVNLAPAELPKDSSRFDLPIALGILAASGQLAAARADRSGVRRRAFAHGRAARGARRARHGAFGARRGARLRAAGGQRAAGRARARRAHPAGAHAARSGGAPRRRSAAC